MRYYFIILCLIPVLSLTTAWGMSPAAASPTPTSTRPTPTPTPTETPPPVRVETAFATFEEAPVDTVPAVYHQPIAPNLRNVLVPSALSKVQLTRLAQDGIVASPGQEKEFFTVYEQARYANVPIFITSDSVLHVYHLLFDKTLRTAERAYFWPLLQDLNRALMAEAEAQYRALPKGPWKEAARRTVAFIGVGGRLSDPEFEVPAYAVDLVEAEVAKIEAAEGIQASAIFPDLAEDYTQYIPRGHYTSNETLQTYFKNMMWYGRITFRLKTTNPNIGRAETQAALLLVQALRTAEVDKRLALDVWADLYDPTAFLVGRSDDLTALDYIAAMEVVYGPKPDLDSLVDDTRLDTFIKEMDQLPPPKILGLVIAETEDETQASKGLRLMGQRFVPDAYIFRQLVYRNVGDATKNRRGLPNGLDLMAAFGSERAYQHLEKLGQTKYKHYPAQMDKMQTWVASLTPADWTETLYNTWLYAFLPLIKPPGEGYPAFMQSPAWQDKQLHTALGSWAQLKHDTLLYAKQVYAEMGGGGPAPPRPIPARGYVEPVPHFYARLAALTTMTRQGLGSRDLLSRRDTVSLEDLENLLRDLQTMAEKELRGEPLTEQEHRLIRFYGGRLEHLVMAAADTPEDDPAAMPVLEEEPQAATIADVATDPDPDGDGRPDPVVLQVGVGRINEIHVVVPLIEADGSIFLEVAKGGIFSYYEFPWPAEDRLTDEKWRDMLDAGQAPDPPSWIDSFYTPAGEFSELQAAIYTFQSSLVEAVFYLKTDIGNVLERAEPLAEIASGKALAQVEAEIAALQKQQQYESRQWIQTDYRSFDRQADDLAVVTVRETWQDSLHQYEDQPFATSDIDPVVATRGPYTQDVTYTLQRNRAGKWLVTRIVYTSERPEWEAMSKK